MRLREDADFILLRRLQRRYAFLIAAAVVTYYWGLGLGLGLVMAFWPQLLNVRVVPGTWITLGLAWNITGLRGWFAATAGYAALSTRRLAPLRAVLRERHGWGERSQAGSDELASDAAE